MKTKNILQENMRRFGTKNLNEQPGESAPADFESALKPIYTNINDINDTAYDIVYTSRPLKMEDLPVIQHAVQQLKTWSSTNRAPLEVHILVDEAPALLDAMQVNSKDAWQEMKSHWGAIIDAIADQNKSEYMTQSKYQAYKQKYGDFNK